MDYEPTNNPDDPNNHATHWFCPDATCPDKEDADEVALLGAFYNEGLVSAEDADNIYKGRVF